MITGCNRPGQFGYRSVRKVALNKQNTPKYKKTVDSFLPNLNPLSLISLIDFSEAPWPLTHA